MATERESYNKHCFFKLRNYSFIATHLFSVSHTANIFFFILALIGLFIYKKISCAFSDNEKKNVFMTVTGNCYTFM